MEQDQVIEWIFTMWQVEVGQQIHFLLLVSRGAHALWHHSIIFCSMTFFVANFPQDFWTLLRNPVIHAIWTFNILGTLGTYSSPGQKIGKISKFEILRQPW
jgi:hypothetical protein